MKGKEYMNNLYNALMFNRQNLMSLYEGVEGCKRLAREFGYGLKDFDNRIDLMKSSYGSICVRFYLLKSPIDNKIWVKEIMSQWN